MTTQRRLLKQIVENTKPKLATAYTPLAEDPDAPQKTRVYGPYNCSTIFAGVVAVTGLELRPPEGTYYRLVLCKYYCTTGAGSAANSLMAYICTDAEAVAEGTAAPPVGSKWSWRSPVLVASNFITAHVAPGQDYVAYTEAVGYLWYYVPFPNILITNSHPFRLAAAPVNGDTVYAKITYEVVRT